VLPPPLDGRVRSLDLRFSAPNSVSWVWAQADIDLRAELEQATFAAANDMLSYMTQTNPVADGEPAQGFAAATVLHVTVRDAQRVPPPLLHVHCHLVGVQEAGGALLPMAPKALNADGVARACGAVGRLRLAERLRELRFQIDPGTGFQGRYFEIAGVPRELLRPADSVRAVCNGPVQEATYGR
jgi:TrwC relaxase